MSCKTTREKEGMTHIIDLMYPRKVRLSFVSSDRLGFLIVVKQANSEPMPTEFAAILRNSLLRNISHKATCSICKHLAIFTSKRYISSRDLPPILVVNANVYNDEAWEFWQDSRNKVFLQSQVNLHGQIDGADDPEVASYVIRVRVTPPKDSTT